MGQPDLGRLGGPLSFGGATKQPSDNRAPILSFCFQAFSKMTLKTWRQKSILSWLWMYLELPHTLRCLECLLENRVAICLLPWFQSTMITNTLYDFYMRESIWRKGKKCNLPKLLKSSKSEIPWKSSTLKTQLSWRSLNLKKPLSVNTQEWRRKS